MTTVRSNFIDICRGLAVLGVMFHHFYFVPLTDAARLFGWEGSAHTIAMMANNGWLGVNVFFILSGLVLFRPGIISSLTSVSEYYRVRILRLLPLYFLFIFFIALAEHRSLHRLVSDSFWLLTGLHNLVPKLQSWMPAQVLWVCWSLGIEILFSLVLPLIVWTMTHAGVGRTVMAICAAAFLWRIGGDWTWYHLTPAHLDYKINPLKDNIIGRLDDFVVGMAAAHLMQIGWRPHKALVFGAIAAFAITLLGWGYVAMSGRPLWISLLVSALHLTFSSSVAVLMIAFARWPGWERRAWQPFVYAGVVCYSAYFVHAVLIKFVPRFDTSKYWEVAGYSWPALAGSFALFVTITFAVAGLMFCFVESTGIRKLPRWVPTVARRDGT